MNTEQSWEKENLTIKEFREKYAQEIDILLRAVPGSEWPEHQVARILYSLFSRQKEEIIRHFKAEVEAGGLPAGASYIAALLQPQETKEVLPSMKSDECDGECNHDLKKNKECLNCALSRVVNSKVPCHKCDIKGPDESETSNW